MVVFNSTILQSLRLPYAGFVIWFGAVLLFKSELDFRPDLIEHVSWAAYEKPNEFKLQVDG